MTTTDTRGSSTKDAMTRFHEASIRVAQAVVAEAAAEAHPGLEAMLEGSPTTFEQRDQIVALLNAIKMERSEVAAYGAHLMGLRS